MTSLKPFEHFATNAIHAGQDPEKWNSRAVIPPISMATTFKQDNPSETHGYDYSRSGNPTRECFEQCVAAIDGAKYGLAFSSGLGATTTLMMMLSSGDHVIVMDDVYGGTNRLLSKVVANHNIEFSFVDCRDLGLLEKSIKPGKTKMLWIETPTNPTMKIVDIEGACKIARKFEGITVVTDNTFMSPYFQRPLMWGSDITFHSVTKYINGHSDACLGMICTSNDELFQKLKYLQNAAGCVPSPFDCYLANRGVKTLHVRMKQHQENALAVAKYLEASPRVKKVIYPGLPSHPQHELVKKQCTGFSGMLSFDIHGDLQTSRTFLSSLKVFTLAESLGGFESLAELPAVMTHASVDADHRAVLGITDTLIRFSVGLEDSADLVADVDQALKKAIPDSELAKLK
ncbi:cystathionine gamma-lyase-like [Rhopilema esculentum]|uniref:cystathionine gamma-lyase-like n=1 Tax=Rhopilema esculentum TaxID=499914 RepID=UPI0031D25C4E